VASAVSIATGLSAYAAARPLGHLAGILDDRIDLTSPPDAVRGALTGAASPDSKQRYIVFNWQHRHCREFLQSTCFATASHCFYSFGPILAGAFCSR
jgi:hypothetical protein